MTDAELVVRQGAVREDGLDMATIELMNQNMKSGIIEDLYKRNEEVIQSKDDYIEELKDRVV